MEAFERAHIKKKPVDKHLKKHLKQLLDGYKENDTKAIKNADKNYREMDNSISNDSYESDEKTDSNVPKPDIEEELSNSSVCTDDASDIMSSDNEDSDLTQDIFSKINKLSEELATDKSNSESSQQIDSESTILETVQEEESECDDDVSIPAKTIPDKNHLKRYMFTNSDKTSQSSQQDNEIHQKIIDSKVSESEVSINDDSNSSSVLSENIDNTNSSSPSETELVELFDRDGGLAMNIKQKLLINNEGSLGSGKLKRKYNEDSASDETDSDKNDVDETCINQRRPKKISSSPSAISILSQTKLPVSHLDDVLENYKHSTYKYVSFQNNEHSFLDNINKIYKKTISYVKETDNEVGPNGSAMLSNTVDATGIEGSSNVVEKADVVIDPPSVVDGPSSFVGEPPVVLGGSPIVVDGSSIEVNGPPNVIDWPINVVNGPPDVIDWPANVVNGHPDVIDGPANAINESSVIDPNAVNEPPNTVERSNTVVPPHMVLLNNHPALLFNTPAILLAPIVQQDGQHNIAEYELVNADVSNNAVVNTEIHSSVQFIPDYGTSSRDNVEMLLSADETDDNTSLEERIKVYCHKSSCIFVLKHPAELYIHGKVKVRCLAGKAIISGYTLTDTFSEIFAPNFNYSQCLKTVENENVYYGLFNKLTSIGFSVNDVEDIVISLGKQDVVLCFQPLKSRKFDFVEKNFTKTNVFSKIDKKVDLFLQQPSQLLGCSFFSRHPLKYFVTNPEWNKAFEFESNLTRGIICGGKRVGKSTFLKYYVNKKLAQGPVLVVDLDPGQCEFTVAGNVSATVVDKPLLGPNFTHLTIPDLTLCIGSINVMDNVTRYVKAVSLLLNYCHSKEQYRNMPWIINTMGMCNVIGHMLLHYIILKLKPTFLIQMESTNIKKKFDYFNCPDKVKEAYYNDHNVNNLFNDIQPPEQLDYTFILIQQDKMNISNNLWLKPIDERYLNFLAYFGELMLQHKKTDFLGIVPYELPLSNLCIISNVGIEARQVNRVLNGKIVALCSALDPHCALMRLGDYPVICHGYGLVRGINTNEDTSHFYITTPCPDNRVQALLYMDWVPELVMDPSAIGAVVPYRTPMFQGHDQLLQSPQRRFNPLQLIKIIKASST